MRESISKKKVRPEPHFPHFFASTLLTLLQRLPSEGPRYTATRRVKNYDDDLYDNSSRGPSSELSTKRLPYPAF